MLHYLIVEEEVLFFNAPKTKRMCVLKTLYSRATEDIQHILLIKQTPDVTEGIATVFFLQVTTQQDSLQGKISRVSSLEK